MTERDHQNQLLRTNENDLHAMEKKENTLSNQIRDKDIMEERIATMTNEIGALQSKLKVCPRMLRLLEADDCLCPYESRNSTQRFRRHKHLLICLSKSISRL
jgi:hypothetical protein